MSIAVGPATSDSPVAWQDRGRRLGYATGRGTTIRIAVLDRVTGEYRDNGGAAHQPVESASVMKVFIAENLLHRRDAGQITLAPRPTCPT